VPDGAIEAANSDASKAKEGKKPADETATKVADLAEKTNLTPAAALAQVRAEAAKPAKTPRAKKAAAKKTTKPVKSAKKGEATTSREGTAKAKVIAMMHRKGGATLDSIMPYASHSTSASRSRHPSTPQSSLSCRWPRSGSRPPPRKPKADSLW
jgi:hypothetical protein